MTVEELRRAVADGEVDTVLLAFADMQGRLQGKRLTAEFFVDEVVGHAAEGCNYLLAVDVEMNTVDGYAMSSWDTGYGDFVMKPDLPTLRPVPWLERTALCMADLTWEDDSDVVASPRQILRRQLARLADRGWEAHAATELEFMIFRDTYEQAWHKAYRDLEPANLYNIDYSLMGTARVEPLIQRIRTSMGAAGMPVENSKGECNFGQHEINFRYQDALSAADTHVIYKNGAKEIAAQDGMAITYMAKFDEREGNSCHVHLSVRETDGTPLFSEQPKVFESFVAGQLAGLREITLFLAPNVNSYKRYAEGSFAPTAVAWGRDNRTCALRVVGHGAGLRVENRAPGGDVNPYLALAAMIASGLDGIDRELALEPAFEGNAYKADKPRVPSTLREARDEFAGSRLAREAFGSDVVEHYLNNARVELAAFESAVTDWERFRGFERL
jgi:glutamine synthetase